MSVLLSIIIILIIIIFIISSISLFNKDKSSNNMKDPKKLIRFIALFLLSSVIISLIIVFAFMFGLELIKNIAILALLLLMLFTIIYLIF